MSNSGLAPESIIKDLPKVINALWEGELPGMNKSYIYVKFDKPVIEGDRLTYDVYDGQFLYVVSCCNNIAICKIITLSYEEWIPIKCLEHGQVWQRLDGKIFNEYQ